MAPLTWFYCKY